MAAGDTKTEDSVSACKMCSQCVDTQPIKILENHYLPGIVLYFDPLNDLDVDYILL